MKIENDCVLKKIRILMAGHELLADCDGGGRERERGGDA
jgi:hypothetical protein